MSTKLKALIALSLGILLFYFACNKAAVKNTQTDNAAIGSQLAVNLYKSITGSNGGNNAASGSKTPNGLLPNSHGKQINSTITFTCGATSDTTLSYITPMHDTTQSYIQHIKYALICNGQMVNGYSMLDSVGITSSAATLLNNVTVIQSYTMKALDTTYKRVSMDGSIVNNTLFSTLNSSKTVTESHKINAYYALTGYIVDASSGMSVITAGTSTFTAYQTDLNTVYGSTATTISYTGTITFTGNNIAKITFTINGGAAQSYTVNVTTGAIINT